MTPERWKQLEDLYHSAYARRLANGRRFCERLPADDALRREVQALLEQSESAEGLLSESALEVHPIFPVVPGDMTDRALGGYQLQTLLGAGGMGEVYRAHDSKLGRDVAIKVLPAEFTSDPGRLARLEREARMLAALNHPNICGIYGFEEAGQPGSWCWSSSRVRLSRRGSARLASLFLWTRPSRLRDRSPRRSRLRTNEASSTAT